MSNLSREQIRQHDAVENLSSIWVNCIDGCTPGREHEIDKVFEELGKLRLEKAVHLQHSIQDTARQKEIKHKERMEKILEPGCELELESIAVSLKRIADELETIAQRVLP